MNKIKFWKKNDDLNLEDNLPFDKSTDLNSNLDIDPTKDPYLDNKDPLGLEQGTSNLLEKSGSIDNPLSFQEKADLEPVKQQTFPSTNNKDLELISAKLDTIKAELDAVNQRIQKIEKIVEHSEKDKKALW